MEDRKIIRHSFAVRLSLRFMFVLTVAVILLSLGFLFFLRSLVQNNQTEELRKAENAIYSILEETGEDYIDDQELPYYLTYIAYDVDSEEIIATNDPFLPLLKDTGGKAVHYIEQNYFSDGNLDILYSAETHELNRGSATGLNGGAVQQIVVAVAMNVENDTFRMIFAKLPLTLIQLSIPVLLLSFLVCLLISKNTINPVVKITRTVRSMNTEDLDRQLPVTGQGDEIDELSATFNDLFLRIKADFDRERQFSSDVSHELNTPLTVISGQAGLLLRWGKDNPEQLEKSLNAIKNEAKSMHAIIENLLQISRVESGRIKPQVSEVDVATMFERVSGEMTAVADGVKFESECQTPLKVETDPEMLHQILTVLVSNSVKFAGSECRVRLNAVAAEEGGVLITESDDGPGIAEESLPHVFERFYRGDEAHTRAAGGSGLGLSIAKTLVEALGGDITAGNIKPHGARFQLYFPA